MHDPTSQRLKCKLCGVCFASHTQRREHRLHKHKDMTVIHCKKCLKTFAVYAQLKRHVCGRDDDAADSNSALVHNAPSHRKRKRQSCESGSGPDDSDEDFLDDSSSISEDDALSSNDVDSQSDFGGDVRNRRITARDLARIDRKMAYGEAWMSSDGDSDDADDDDDVTPTRLSLRQLQKKLFKPCSVVVTRVDVVLH